MSESPPALVWSIIRQEENGNSYRVGSYASEEEARRIVDSLDGNGHRPLYEVRRIS